MGAGEAFGTAFVIVCFLILAVFAIATIGGALVAGLGDQRTRLVTLLSIFSFLWLTYSLQQGWIL